MSNTKETPLGMPPFDYERPSLEDRRKYFGENLINNFKKDFEEHFWGSPQSAEAFFHTIFGQIPGIRDRYIPFGGNYLDNRIHTLLIQETSTGKSEGFDYAKKVVEGVFHKNGSDKKIWVSPDRITDAILVGSMTQGKNNEIRKEIGILDEKSGYKYVIQTEATLTLDQKATQYNQSGITHYQRMCDPIGKNTIQSFNLTIGTEGMDCNPVSSCLFTTYPPPVKKMYELTITGGLIPRMVALYNPIAWEDWVDNSRKMATKVFKRKGNDSVETIDIITTLKAIQYWFTKNPLERVRPWESPLSCSVTDEQWDDIYMKNFIKPISKLDPEVRDIIRRFVNRKFTHLVILSTHYAMMDLKRVVDINHVLLGLNVLMEPYQRLITFIEQNPHLKDNEMKDRLAEFNDVRKTYDKLIKGPYKNTKGWIPLNVFVKALINGNNTLGKSVKTVKGKLDNHIHNGQITLQIQKIHKRNPEECVRID